MARFADEKELARLGSLILTSARVRAEASALGATSVRSIMLDQVSFCGVESRTYPLFLVLAGIGLLIGAAGTLDESMGEWMVPGFAAAAVLVLLYFATRQSVVSVASSGGRLSTRAARLKHDAVAQFIDAVETARRESVAGGIPH